MLGPRALGKGPALIVTLVRLLESLTVLHLLHLHTRAVLYSPIQPWILGQLEPVLLTSALLGNIQRRGRVTLLLQRLGVKRLCWARQEEMYLK